MDLTMLECNRKCLEYKKTVIHYGKTVYHYGRWRTFREILRILKEQNVEIYALLMPDENPIINHPGIHYIYGDVCRTESLQPLLDGAESKETVVIHTAGIISIAQDVSPDMYAVNVNGTKKMVQISRENGVKRFVYVSSVHAMPEKPLHNMICEVDSFSPESVIGGYAKTKAEASQLIMDASAKGFPAIIVQPSGILGPYDKGRNHLIQLVAEYIAGKLPVCVKGGYNFVDVRDVAAGCLLAAENGVVGQSYILSGHYLSIHALLSSVGHYCHKKPIPALPVCAAKLAAPFIEAYMKKQGKRPLYTNYSLHTLTSNSCFSNSKAQKELGFCPRNIEETICDMTNWILKNGVV